MAGPPKKTYPSLGSLTIRLHLRDEANIEDDEEPYVEAVIHEAEVVEVSMIKDHVKGLAQREFDLDVGKGVEQFVNDLVGDLVSQFLDKQKKGARRGRA